MLGTVPVFYIRTACSHSVTEFYGSPFCIRLNYIIVMASRDEFKVALRSLRPEMLTSLNVRNIIVHCHVDAGGFLNTTEEEQVMSHSRESEKVYDLIGILISKDDKAFRTFCDVLVRCNYRTLANRLAEKAGELYM